MKNLKQKGPLPFGLFTFAIVIIFIIIVAIAQVWLTFGSEFFYCRLPYSHSSEIEMMVHSANCSRYDADFFLYGFNLFFLLQIISAIGILRENWLAWISILPAAFSALFMFTARHLGLDFQTFFLLLPIVQFLLILYYRHFFSFPFLKRRKK